MAILGICIVDFSTCEPGISELHSEHLACIRQLAVEKVDLMRLLGFRRFVGSVEVVYDGKLRICNYICEVKHEQVCTGN